MSALREIALVRGDDGKWEIRTLIGGWGIVGARMLKGEGSLPPHRDLELDKAVEAYGKWQEFVRKQDDKVRRKSKKLVNILKKR